jgi:hypothetical protein
MLNVFKNQKNKEELNPFWAKGYYGVVYPLRVNEFFFY